MRRVTSSASIGDWHRGHTTAPSMVHQGWIGPSAAFETKSKGVGGSSSMTPPSPGGCARSHREHMAPTSTTVAFDESACQPDAVVPSSKLLRPDLEDALVGYDP